MTRKMRNKVSAASKDYWRRVSEAAKLLGIGKRLAQGVLTNLPLGAPVEPAAWDEHLIRCLRNERAADMVLPKVKKVAAPVNKRKRWHKHRCPFCSGKGSIEISDEEILELLARR